MQPYLCLPHAPPPYSYTPPPTSATSTLSWPLFLGPLGTLSTSFASRRPPAGAVFSLSSCSPPPLSCPREGSCFLTTTLPHFPGSFGSLALCFLACGATSQSRAYLPPPSYPPLLGLLLSPPLALELALRCASQPHTSGLRAATWLPPYAC